MTIKIVRSVFVVVLQSPYLLLTINHRLLKMIASYVVNAIYVNVNSIKKANL
ncbi:MAG: hypothetical protein PUA88_08110 [Bacillales bacterium]|nr:hypothetical protein [Bacillales bacterium]